MLSSSINSASYSNMKSDMYRVVKDALAKQERQLEDITILLSAIHDLLKGAIDE